MFLLFLLLSGDVGVLLEKPHEVVFVKEIRVSHESLKKGRIKTVLLGKEPGEIRPSGICFLRDNKLGLTDTWNKRVYIIDRNGHILKTLTETKNGSMRGPVGICSDRLGNVYVSDRERILEFTSDFSFGQAIGGFDDSRLTGLAAQDGDLFAVDTPNHRILIFDESRTVKHSFGGRGNDPGRFNFPTHVAVDDGLIYISDALNFRVQIFDLSGHFIRMFGCNGVGGGNFSKPKGIGVDRNKRIFVADAMFDNVQIFSSGGAFLHFFGASGNGPGEFWMPADLAVDEEDRIWVTDTHNGRIQVFEVQERP